MKNYAFLPATRRTGFVSIGIVLAAVLFAASPIQKTHAAETYPIRPVSVVVSFDTGGVSDIVARMLAEELGKTFGQRFLVENRPGADGVLASQTALAGGNEGYSLFNLGNAATIRRTTRPNEPNDIDKFDPISPIAQFGLVMVTRPGSDIKTVQDVVKYAKANPGALNIGTVSRGSTQNLAAELFKTVSAIKATVIPFKKTPDVMGAVARHEVDIGFEIIAGAKNAIESGLVIPIATTQNQRSKAFPNVPTVEESGVKPYEVVSWSAWAVPKGAPKSVVTTLNRELQRILSLPTVQQKMLTYGIEPYLGGPEVVTEAFKSQTEKWRKVIVDSGISIQK